MFYICYNTDSQISQEFKKDFSIFFLEKCVRIKVSQFFYIILGNFTKEGHVLHELSITKHLLDYCIKKAEEQHAYRIQTIRLSIGQLKGIVPECIQIYLDMLSEGTIAESAKIEAEFLPVKIRCRDCNKESAITPHHLACPHCNSLRLQLLSGKEFYIKSMEVEIDGNNCTTSNHGLE